MSFGNGDMLPAIGGCILPLIGRPQVVRMDVQDCLRSSKRPQVLFRAQDERDHPILQNDHGG